MILWEKYYMSIVCHIRELDGMPVDPTKTKLELEVEIMG